MQVKPDYELDSETPFKSKKFVFKVYPEYVDYIEQMDVPQRNEFINQAIEQHLAAYNQWQKYDTLIGKIKQIAIYMIIITLCIPTMIMFFKLIFSESQNTDQKMQYNFEKVIDSYKK